MEYGREFSKVYLNTKIFAKLILSNLKESLSLSISFERCLARSIIR